MNFGCNKGRGRRKGKVGRGDEGGNTISLQQELLLMLNIIFSSIVHSISTIRLPTSSLSVNSQEKITVNQPDAATKQA